MRKGCVFSVKLDLEWIMSGLGLNLEKNGFSIRMDRDFDFMISNILTEKII